MSATIDADRISAYFGHCPTLHVPGRTFPVDVRYLEDALELTKWHIDESSPYARRCEYRNEDMWIPDHLHLAVYDKFYQAKSRPEWSEDLTPGDDDEDQTSPDAKIKLGKRYSLETAATINLLDERLIPHGLIIRLIETICFEDASYAPYSSAILVFMPGLAEIRRLVDTLSEHPLLGNEDAFRIYPLHSTLSSESQSAVFEVPPNDIRKIVICTHASFIIECIPEPWKLPTLQKQV